MAPIEELCEHKVSNNFKEPLLFMHMLYSDVDGFLVNSFFFLAFYSSLLCDYGDHRNYSKREYI